MEVCKYILFTIVIFIWAVVLFGSIMTGTFILTALKIIFVISTIEIARMYKFNKDEK